MSRRLQVLLIALIVAPITVVISHVIVHALGIRTGMVEYRVVGANYRKPLVYVAGSSLLSDALSFDEVSKVLKQGMETWFVPGSSPCEWEASQSGAPSAGLTIIGVSAYDLNEAFFCDFRASFVPLSHAIRDLVRSDASWGFAKRVVSLYPLTYLRHLFPTVGRSQGVMGGVRERVERLLRPGVKVESDAGPTAPAWGAAVEDPARTGRISDWSTAYLLRRLAKLRSACQGLHFYDGPKSLALRRMLEQARRQGDVVVLVLPVSPAYQKEFLDALTTRRFETALADHQRAVPGVQWIRLDQLPQLNSSDFFWDVVHMNVFGQRIATEHFLRRVREYPAQP